MREILTESSENPQCPIETIDPSPSSEFGADQSPAQVQLAAQAEVDASDSEDVFDLSDTDSEDLPTDSGSEGGEPPRPPETRGSELPEPEEPNPQAIETTETKQAGPPEGCPFHETANQVGKTALNEAQEKSEAAASSPEIKWPDNPNDSKGYRQAAWKLHGAEHKQLRNLMEDMTDTLIDAIEAKGPIDLKEATAQHHPVTVPGSLAVTTLPPTLFDRLDESKPPVIPASEAAKSELVEDYSNRQKNDPMPDDYRWSPREDFEGAIVPTLRELERKGETIDPATWERYKDAAKQQREDGWLNLERVAAFREDNTSNMRDEETIYSIVAKRTELQEAEEVMVTYVPVKNTTYTTPADHLVLPVSEYGKDFTEKLSRSTAFIGDTALEESVTNKAAEKGQENAELLLKYTARSRATGDPQTGLCSTTREGVMSSAQALALLTGHKVEGYESGEALLKDVVDQGLVEQFVRSAPAGLLGPLTLRGYTCPDIVQNAGTDDAGNPIVRINPAKLSELKEAKKAVDTFMAKGWKEHIENPDEPLPDMMGMVCPAAMPNGAVTRLAQTFSRTIAG